MERWATLSAFGITVVILLSVLVVVAVLPSSLEVD